MLICSLPKTAQQTEPIKRQVLKIFPLHFQRSITLANHIMLLENTFASLHQATNYQHVSIFCLIILQYNQAQNIHGPQKVLVARLVFFDILAPQRMNFWTLLQLVQLKSLFELGTCDAFHAHKVFPVVLNSN